MIINNFDLDQRPVCGERILQGICEGSPAISPGILPIISSTGRKRKPRAILTTCATDIGVSESLRITERRYSWALEIDVVACDYAMLASNKTGAVFMRYDVLAIRRHAGPAHRQRAVVSARLADLRRGESYLMRLFGSLTTPERWRDQQPAAENFSLRQ